MDMKIISLTIILLSVLALSACTASLPQGDIVFNFCDIDTNDYISCPTIALSASEIDMTLVSNSSDVVSIDSVAYELPDAGVYCSTDSTTLTTDDAETYSIALPCDLSAYSEQNTQLSYTATVTLNDGSTISITGKAEDWVEG
ncbi:hypothetical protein HZA99_04655 [Candidatus Woesearchaeota archaeon]|nr:hypothetical protein [Candidatus Woesearchaeota archaeon]